MEVRYIEIKTSPAGQIIRAYTPEQYKKEMARRKNAAARARKLNRRAVPVRFRRMAGPRVLRAGRQGGVAA